MSSWQFRCSFFYRNWWWAMSQMKSWTQVQGSCFLDYFVKLECVPLCVGNTINIQNFCRAFLPSVKESLCVAMIFLVIEISQRRSRNGFRESDLQSGQIFVAPQLVHIRKSVKRLQRIIQVPHRLPMNSVLEYARFRHWIPRNIVCFS